MELPIEAGRPIRAQASVPGAANNGGMGARGHVLIAFIYEVSQILCTPKQRLFSRAINIIDEAVRLRTFAASHPFGAMADQHDP